MMQKFATLREAAEILGEHPDLLEDLEAAIDPPGGEA
jgi:hypothetical protein